MPRFPLGTPRETPGEQWIVAVGDIGTGYQFYGPFPDINAAVQWPERERMSDNGLEWVACALRDPEEV